MRTLLLACLLLPAAASAQAPVYGCDTPESHQLDFWVGDWDLTYPNAKGEPAKSRNRITKTLDGCVVMEEFTGGAGTKLDGRSLSTYDRASKRWKQVWVDNTASYLDFEAATVDGNMAFARTVERAGKTSHQRMVFRDVKPDSLKWVWQQSTDGTTWSTQWEIDYKRVK
jgi:hypothetical protein